MKVILYILSLLVGLSLFGQDKPLIYRNFGPVAFTFEKDNFYSCKIHEIVLNPDSTFEFWSRPQINCLTWDHYKGRWSKEKDTLLFLDKYEVKESDMRVTYQKDTSQYFTIKFKTDKNSELKDNTIKVEFIYDFKSHMRGFENPTEYKFNSDNTIKIPFNSILNLYLLAAIRIEYQLNPKEKRWGYLTENKTINIREGSISNIINVEFVEIPKKETVSRISKGVIKSNELVIVSTNKTKITLPDYHRDIEFANFYPLGK
jgi:hypothetical protein